MALAAGVVVAGGKLIPSSCRPLTGKIDLLKGQGRKRKWDGRNSPLGSCCALLPFHHNFNRSLTSRAPKSLWSSVLLFPKRSLASAKRSKQPPPADLKYPTNLPADEKQGKSDRLPGHSIRSHTVTATTTFVHGFCCMYIFSFSEDSGPADGGYLDGD